MIGRRNFEMIGNCLVICRNKQGKWLSVKECRNNGWWLPGGLVNPPENFYQAAIRECQEEAGIDIKIKGILRVEYSIRYMNYHNYQRLTLVFYAEPIDENQKPKSFADNESEEAQWHSVEELLALRQGKPGWRGPELYLWATYLEKGGAIYPLSCLARGNTDAKLTSTADVMTITKPQVSGSNSGPSSVNSLDEFISALKTKDECWFLDKNADAKVNGVRDERRNNAFQIAMLAKNTVFAKNCLMLLDNENLVSSNFNYENVLLTTLQFVSEKEMIKYVLAKLSKSLNSYELDKLLNSQDKSGTSAAVLLSSLVQDKEVADVLSGFPQVKQLIKL